METSIAVGLIFGAVHLMVLAVILYCIFFADEQDWPMYWAILILIDFPASLIGVAVGRSLKKIALPDNVSRLHVKALDLHNFILPMLLFGVSGTVWWFYLPQGIAKLFEAFAR